MRVRLLCAAMLLFGVLTTSGSVWGAGVKPNAANDYDPPVVVSLTASPTTVAPGGTVTLTAHITDAGTGVNGDSIFASYYPPSGNSASAYSWTRAVTGTDNDNTWTSTLTAPAVANSGTWIFGSIQVSDKVGNQAYLSNSDACNPPSIGNDFFVDNGGAVPAPFPKAICEARQCRPSCRGRQYRHDPRCRFQVRRDRDVRHHARDERDFCQQ